MHFSVTLYRIDKIRGWIKQRNRTAMRLSGRHDGLYFDTLVRTNPYLALGDYGAPLYALFPDSPISRQGFAPLGTDNKIYIKPGPLACRVPFAENELQSKTPKK